MTTQQTSLADFIEKHGITMDWESEGFQVDRSEGRSWEHMAYTVTLSKRDGDPDDTLVTPWKQGLGIERDPQAADVLDSLASDSASIENAGDFWDWVDEFGMEATREAEATYRTCRRQAEFLKAFLGDEAYDELLWNTERQ